MILNKTTGEIIRIKIIYADNFYKRFKGLMLKKDIDFALLFSDFIDSSIHTSFMRFAIDIYFLDENKVIYEKVTLKPWKFYKPKKQANYILETKKNELKLKIGEKLDFV
jgi:uncharacterized membrane protein (UPF0127 family)